MMVAVDGSIFTIDLKKEKNMSHRAKDISKRIGSFADEVITFVES